MLHIAILTGGGVLPTHGSYTIALWAKWIGKSEDYVDDFFTGEQIPYERFGGDVRLFDAEVVRPYLKTMTPATDPKRLHGGKRK